MICDDFMDGSVSSDAESDKNIEGTSSSSLVFAPAAGRAQSEWEQWKILLDIACHYGAKQTAKYNAYKLYCDT